MTESTSEGSAAPSSLDSYYSATHLSLFAKHLLLKTLDSREGVILKHSQILLTTSNFIHIL